MKLDDRGFTLLELIAVAALIAVLYVYAGSSLNFGTGSQEIAEVRRFANTWQFLFGEALGRGEAYRLVIDLDNQSYSAFREVPEVPGASRQVDHLENLRIDSQKKRRAERKQRNLEAEYEEEDARQSGNLDGLFYQFLFSDAAGDDRLAPLLEFPSLQEPVKLSSNVLLRDVKLANELVTSGQIFIRLSPRGSSDFAVVHLIVNEQPVTVFMNPSTGETTVIPREVDFEWNMGQEKSAS